MAKVTVENYGTFEINNDRLMELVGWLSKNEAVKIQSQPIREISNNQFTGRELITENNNG